VDQEKDDGSSKVLNALVKYIPTEVIAVYIAVFAAAESITKVFPNITTEVLYWAFVILAPLLFLLIYLRKRKVQEITPIFPNATKEWVDLLWNLAAAVIAFAVWALAIPDNPYVKTTEGSVVVGVAAVIVSFILNLFAPFFEKETV
jgi:hypothetical protein